MGGKSESWASYVKKKIKIPNNYRSVTLLPSMYKIGASIVRNRINIILNLLPNERQCAYEKHKSTIDIIYEIKQGFIKKTTKGQLLLDLTKAFGGYSEKSHMWALFKIGLPIELLRMIIIGRIDTKLCAKRNGHLSRFAGDNACIFHGCPLSAQLFIIYADYGM